MKNLVQTHCWSWRYCCCCCRRCCCCCCYYCNCYFYNPSHLGAQKTDPEKKVCRRNLQQIHVYVYDFGPCVVKGGSRTRRGKDKSSHPLFCFPYHRLPFLRIAHFLEIPRLVTLVIAGEQRRQGRGWHCRLADWSGKVQDICFLCVQYLYLIYMVTNTSKGTHVQSANMQAMGEVFWKMV